MPVDTTFGNEGWWYQSAPYTTATILQGMAIQSDGKILVSGGYTPWTATVSRINADGTPDLTFGTRNGTASWIPSGGTTGAAFGVAVLSDGSIIAVGSSTRASDGAFVQF